MAFDQKKEEILSGQETKGRTTVVTGLFTSIKGTSKRGTICNPRSTQKMMFVEETEEEKRERDDRERIKELKQQINKEHLDYKRAQAQNVDGCLELFKDSKYKESDGFYIILRGYVDILSQKDN